MWQRFKLYVYLPQGLVVYTVTRKEGCDSEPHLGIAKGDRMYLFCDDMRVCDGISTITATYWDGRTTNLAPRSNIYLPMEALIEMVPELS